MTRRQSGKLFAYDATDTPTDAGIDLIEGESRDTGIFGEDGFEGQHEAGSLTAGGDLRQGFQRLAKVGGNLEFDPIYTGGGESVTRGINHAALSRIVE